MTEAEWLACIDPDKMVGILWGKVSDRKLRLFAVACCRRIWQLLPDERSRQAIEVAERFVDAQATEEELETAADAAARVVWPSDRERTDVGGEGSDELEDYVPHTAPLAAYNVAIPPGWWGAAPAFVAPHNIVREVSADSGSEGAAQCKQLRDILGNPFRPVSLVPAWQSWQGGLLVSMAQRMYDSHDFSGMPVLADALEEAGCTNSDILSHCRQPGEHVRGCWVVDLLLGKS